jgi:hypothetical protein
MWEGMIDTNKRYTFSMIANRETKRRQHLIPSNKKCNRNFEFAGSLFNLTPNAMMNTMERRQQLLSQTLREDILKFDLNASIVRDSFQVLFSRYD